MEAMNVRVRSITPSPKGHTLTALVTATSRERYRGRPVGRIEIILRLPAIKGEPAARMRERVRVEALAYLDPA